VASWVPAVSGLIGVGLLSLVNRAATTPSGPVATGSGDALTAPTPMTSPTAQSAPHPRYLGLGGYSDGFDHGEMPASSVDSDVAYHITRSMALDEDGHPVYSLRFDWTWIVPLSGEESDLVADAAVVASTDYKPTAVLALSASLVLVAGVDRDGCALVERWTLGPAHKVEVRDAAGVLTARELRPGQVNARARGFLDPTGVLGPINGLSDSYVVGGERKCLVRDALSGSVHEVRLGPRPSAQFAQVFAPSQIPAPVPGDAHSERVNRNLVHFWGTSFVYSRIERSVDTPVASDLTVRLQPNHEQAERLGAPVLTLFDAGGDGTIDEVRIGP